MPDKATRFPVGLKFFVWEGRNGFFRPNPFLLLGLRQKRGTWWGIEDELDLNIFV